MAWLCTNKDGTENKFSIKPIRWNNGIITLWSSIGKGKKTELPYGTIKKLIGRELTWEDAPVEIKDK